MISDTQYNPKTQAAGRSGCGWSACGVRALDLDFHWTALYILHIHIQLAMSMLKSELRRIFGVSVGAVTTLNFEFTVFNWENEEVTRCVIYFHFSQAAIRRPTLILDTVHSLNPVSDHCSVTKNQKSFTDVSLIKTRAQLVPCTEVLI
jgi:hypothetical protein